MAQVADLLRAEPRDPFDVRLEDWAAVCLPKPSTVRLLKRARGYGRGCIQPRQANTHGQAAVGMLRSWNLHQFRAIARDHIRGMCRQYRLRGLEPLIREADNL